MSFLDMDIQTAFRLRAIADIAVACLFLIYRNKDSSGHFKDYDFRLGKMRRHWQAGLDDMRHTLAHPEWLAAPSPEHPFVTHDVHRIEGG